jgi:hypothetical protein
MSQALFYFLLLIDKMSSVGNSGGDSRETSQERHPVDLAAKTTLKTTVDCTRPTSVSIKFYFDILWEITNPVHMYYVAYFYYYLLKNDLCFIQ